MRLIEAAVGGVVATVVAVMVASRIGIGDLAVVGVVAFGVSFLAVLMRPDRGLTVGKR